MQLTHAHHASWVVVDGYQFDVEYQRKSEVCRTEILVVDDTGHAGAYVADVVLDQNAMLVRDLSTARIRTHLLLGPRYALLRREFKSWRKWKREIAPIARKVLVTVGGTDPDNVTVRIIRALRLLAEEKLEATIVIGGAQSAW